MTINRVLVTAAAAAIACAAPLSVLTSGVAQAVPGYCNGDRSGLTVPQEIACGPPQNNDAAAPPPQVANNDKNIPPDIYKDQNQQDEEDPAQPYDKPGGTPLNPGGPRAQHPNELHIPAA